MIQNGVYIKFGNGVTITNKEIVLSSYQVGDDDLDLDPKRMTNGYLWRNRVLISPSIEFDLTYMKESKMKSIMDYCRNESFTMTFYYPARNSYYKAEVYCPSNYRKPKMLRELPTIIYDIHKLKFIGMKGMTKVNSI